MPAHFVPYLTALVIGINVTATGIQEQSGIVHDGITRFLTKKIPWECFMLQIVQKLFGVLRGGNLILDDTVIAKPYAKYMEGASFVHSSVLDRVVYGYNIVLLSWSNGTITIPLAWKWYRNHGKSKIDLAMRLLYEAKYRWKLTPRSVLFDTYYGADRLLNRLQEYHWKFVGQLKCNRIVNAASIREDLVDEGDITHGYVTDHVKISIIKHDEKYFFTNDLSLSLEKLPELYRYRWPIEEVFRFLKTELRLEHCQARTRQAQKNTPCKLCSCLPDLPKRATGQTKSNTVCHQTRMAD